jgi:hypothetical protein
MHAMEEGPEPQEWVERGVEHHHHHENAHEHEPDTARRATIISAITAAILAVCAALGSLLSGHNANHAIVLQSEASDQWAYYQAKSTKGHIYEASGETISILTEALGARETAKIEPALKRLEQQVQKYDREKEEIKEKAEHLEAQSRSNLQRHQAYALAVAAFQVGIVLASISIMMRYRALWILSLVAGGVGVVFMVIGFFFAQVVFS